MRVRVKESRQGSRALRVSHRVFGSVRKPASSVDLLWFSEVPSAMRVLSTSSVLTALLLSACSPALPKPPEYPSMSPSPAAGGDAAAYDAARAETARLLSEAEKNAILAPWQGPYGGVPPWDKARAEDL